MPDHKQTVLAEAERRGLGPLTHRYARRPGLPGALICLVLLVVAANFAVNGPYNWFGWSVMSLSVLVTAWWAYVWSRRVTGGLYVFRDGFVDAAGQRMLAVTWADVVVITVADTGYAIGGLPTGSTRRYTIAYRIGGREEPAHWYLNTTYPEVATAVAHIARRSGVPVTREPRRP